MRAKIRQIFSTIIDVRELNCNIDFVHQFLQFSLALFWTEIQISLSSDTTLNPPVTHPTLLLFSKQVFVLFFIIQLPPAGDQI